MKITHDLHVHTNLSLCAKPEATLTNQIEAALSYGITTLGITNHCWDERLGDAKDFYGGQNTAHVLSLRDEVEAARRRGDVRVLLGCETEYDYARRGVALTEEAAELFDYVIVPQSHTHMTMPRELYEPHQRHADFMLQAFWDILNSPVARHITAIAHPFSAVCCPYDKFLLLPLIPDDEYRRLFDRTAELGIALEVSMCSFKTASEEGVRNSPFLPMLSIAKECGCRFFFGSDAHHPDQFCCYRFVDAMADALGLTEEDLLPLAR